MPCDGDADDRRAGGGHWPPVTELADDRCDNTYVEQVNICQLNLPIANGHVDFQ